MADEMTGAAACDAPGGMACDAAGGAAGCVSVCVERCREGVAMPQYARAGDAGMDVCSAVDMDIVPGQTALIPTGLKFAIPAGYEIQVRPRSGLSLKTALRLPNSPGTIDSGFRGELGIIVSNTKLPSRGARAAAADMVGDIAGGGCAGGDVASALDRRLDAASLDSLKALEQEAASYPVCPLGGPYVDGPCIYGIRKGDRIAQIVLKAVPTMKFVEVRSVDEIGENRGGGFGSTGVRASS
ncbi:MAG: dUTP diphosphatase [Clostridiales bacterium]|nr:dUTP diphosphatase [Clostridiales bacterium]